MHSHASTANTARFGELACKRVLLLLASAATATLAFIGTPAAAANFRVIHSFCVKSNCNDGELPMSPLVSDAAGNLYGTTEFGGAGGSGTVYRLSPGANGKWTHSVLYSFCAKSGCSDGEFPAIGALILDESGSLYGTTSGRGGTAFKLSPGANSNAPWQLTTLHTFCDANGGNCADGDTPWSGLSYRGSTSGAPYDGHATLFGVTNFGGARGKGTVYTLKPGKSGWRENVIFSFCDDTNCHGGGAPGGSLIVVTDNYLLGAAAHAGQYGGGTIFSLVKALGRWSLTEKYVFCAQTDCTDGAQPSVGALEHDSRDNVYGTTLGGGISGEGVAFKVSIPSSKITQLYSFCHEAQCKDGKLANGGLLMKDTQTFYGTLTNGGNSTGAYSHGAGLVYKISGGSQQILHKFCSSPSCLDGSQPFASAIADKAGALYGTTMGGGRGGQGVVYRITP